MGSKRKNEFASSGFSSGPFVNDRERYHGNWEINSPLPTGNASEYLSEDAFSSPKDIFTGTEIIMY
jgi:hypothetical protein